MAEIYVSTDIEADGPIPGAYSMLSFASAAFDTDGTMIGTFTANLERSRTPPRTRTPWPGGSGTRTRGGRADPISAIPRKR